VTEVEGTGETVGEAKWAALRDLERRHPGLDKTRVSFVVLSEGERGLLGVGYSPARVLARVASAEAPEPPPVRHERPEPPDSPAAHLHELLERICTGLGVSASISIEETDDGLSGRFDGHDVALLIGKHGQTLDAIQYLANAVLHNELSVEGERRHVVVDASGYRDRRTAALERAADRAADDVLQAGEPVALEVMSSVERKVVHTYLQTRPEVETVSEGSEPNRYVVVRKAGEE
jgi:spoIIIJ-associated protein